MIPSESTFLTGIKRVLNSAKVQAAVTVLVPTYFGIRYEAASLPPNQRMGLWVAFLAAVIVLFREVINGWTAEDVASKTPAAPTTQVNTAESQTITPTPAATTTPQTPPAVPFVQRGFNTPLDPTTKP